MNLRLYMVDRESSLVRIAPEPAQASWLEDGRLRWFDIESAPDPLLPKLLAPLGIGPSLLDRYSESTGSSAFIERPNLVLFSHPTPSSWGASGSGPHFACLNNLLVSFRPRPTAKDYDEVSGRWIEGWPLPSPSIAAVLHRILELLGESEKETYLGLRHNTAALGTRIRSEGVSFNADAIEKSLNSVDRVSNFFFDQRLIFTTLQSARTEAFSVGEEADRFRLSATAADDISQGANQLQNRLENLQQQYILEVQAVTDRNIRILTVLSAIFLPLTLIAGIYGMNFEYMPELDERLAYPITLFVMAAMGVGMLSFFAWKGFLK